MCVPILYKAPKPGREPDWEKWCLILLLLIVTILFLSSCNRKVYVPVETVRTETSIRDCFLKDSIYVRDSISVREKGDTVYIERWHTRWRDRVLTDTCYLQRRDSVAVPYPVEKKLSKWNRLKLSYGGIAILILGMAFLAIGVWMFYRLKRRS